MRWPKPSNTQIIAIKAMVFLLCLMPLARLVYGYFYDELGANPLEHITRNTGEWTLRFLLITLCVTPLRHITGMNWLLRLRRMLGLYAFFYGCLHLPQRNTRFVDQILFRSSVYSLCVFVSLICSTANLLRFSFFDAAIPFLSFYCC